jgi:hypothetical protein
MMTWKLSVALIAMVSAIVGWTFDRIDHLETVRLEIESAEVVETVIPSSPPPAPTSAASVGVTAERQPVQHVVGSTTTPPTTVAKPTPGDCGSWRRVFERRGASPEALEFFFDDGIIMRETRCGLDNLNESTGDSGICQINPIHNKPGWFGGVEFGAGGWLGNLHGLTARQNVDSVAWVDACVTLYAVCERGPWTPPYGCAGNPLKTDN